MSNVLLSIGRLAKKSGTSVRMLRYFERFDLLRPIREGHRRLYRPEARNSVATIKVYQSLGLKLRSVRDLKKALAADAIEDALAIAQGDVAKATAALGEHRKRQFFLERLRAKFVKGESPHSYHCFICDARGEEGRNWWGAKLDLVCEPCIERSFRDESGGEVDPNRQCTACGNSGLSPIVRGVDGCLCRTCLTAYVECMRRPSEA